MLRQRVLTAAVLLTLFVAALFLLPNLYWSILLTGVVGIAAWEWVRLAGYSSTVRSLYCAMVVASCAAILAWEQTGSRLFIYSPAGKLLYAAAAAFWLGIVPAWLLYRRQVRSAWLLAISGWLVLMPFWHALVWLQNTPLRLFLAMGVIWLADSAAYFVGRHFGRHKLAPQISPGKTWEGVGGAFAVVVLYWLILTVAVPEREVRLTWGLAGMLLMTVLSIVGDLYESWMKRMAGVKDSGGLLPGHGGVLDRIDGLSAAAPLVALYFAYPPAMT